MKKMILLTSLLVAGLVFSAWTFDVISTKDDISPQLRKELDLKSFERVSVCCGISLHLLSDKENAFYAEGSEDDLENLKIQYKNDKLSIYRDKDGWRGWNLFKGDGPIDVYLSAKGMKAISASSGSEVLMDNIFKSSALDIDFSSGASGQLKVNADKLSVECSSGSELKLEGIALDVRMDLSSGSSCQAKSLSIYKNAQIEASSGASVQITSHGKVEGDVSSGAEVDVYGYPQEVSKEESSGGYVNVVKTK